MAFNQTVWILGLQLALLTGSASLAGPVEEKSYRAGIGLANKGLNELAAEELRSFLKAAPESPHAVSARYTLAVCLVRLGKHEEAAKELDRVVGVEGFEFAGDALFLRAQCSATLGDDAGAEAALKRLLHDQPAFSQADRAVVLYGEVLYRQGKYGPAKTLLSPFGRKWPQSPDRDRAELFLALCELGAGEAQASGRRFEGLLAGAPQGPYAGHAALGAADCQQRLQNPEGAAKFYELAIARGDAKVKADATLALARLERSRGNGEKAAKLLADAASFTQGEMERGEVELERGKLLYDSGKIGDAESVFQPLAGRVAGAELWLARCASRAGRYDQAIVQLDALTLAGGPQFSDALYERAVVLVQAGRDKEAAGAFELWEQRFPSGAMRADAVAARAACLYRLQQYAESKELCERFLGEYSGHERAASVRLLLAENLFLSGAYSDAQSAFAAFVKEYPQDPGVWRARVRRGLCLIKLDRGEAGKKLLNKALVEGGQALEPGLRRVAAMTLADSAINERDWATGEKLLRPFVPESGNDGDLLLRYGICLARQGKNAEAIAALDRACAAGGSVLMRSRLERGQALAAAGRTREAREDLEAVVGAEAKSELGVQARRSLASIASSEGRVSEAAGLLADAADSGVPGAQEILLEQVAAWLGAGEFAKAEAGATRYLEAGGKQVAEAKVRRAIAINRQGRSDEAIRQLESVAGETGGMAAELAAAARYELAYALRLSGQTSRAVAAYESMLRENSGSELEAHAGLELAQIRMAEGDFERAIGLLDRAKQVASRMPERAAGPVNERELYLRGSCLFRMGRMKESAGVLDEFVSRFPQSGMLSSALVLQGDIRLANGNAAEASRCFERVLAGQAGADVVAIALLKLGDAKAALKDWQGAEKAYSDYLAANSTSEFWFQASFGLGWALENQAKYDDALKCYADVVARHEGVTAARSQFQIGECLYARKKLPEALAAFAKVDVLYAYPEWSAAAIYESSRCLDELGKAGEAEAQRQDLLKRFPDSAWARMAGEQRAAPRPTLGSADRLPEGNHGGRE
ncbi:MAG: tetratricopeptide repeat protein [Planctomycetes bacterium]|nr:tetratricopeptide repeat protein [Planctomycetota bacterium]